MSAALQLHASRQSIHALETTPTRDLLDGFGAAYLRLVALVRSSDVQQAQWRSGETPVRAEDAGIRGRGMVSDPTPNVSGDGRRLRLRAAVLEAESALVLAAQAMERAEGRLRKAHERHTGDETMDEVRESTAVTQVHGGISGQFGELWDGGVGTGGPSGG